MQIHWESILTINKLQWQDTDFVLSGQLSKLTEVDKSWSSSKKQSPKALVMDIRMAWMRFFQGAPYSQKWDLPGCCFLEISPQIIRRMSTDVNSCHSDIDNLSNQRSESQGETKSGTSDIQCLLCRSQTSQPDIPQPVILPNLSKIPTKSRGRYSLYNENPILLCRRFPPASINVSYIHR